MEGEYSETGIALDEFARQESILSYQRAFDKAYSRLNGTRLKFLHGHEHVQVTVRGLYGSVAQRSARFGLQTRGFVDMDDLLREKMPREDGLRKKDCPSDIDILLETNIPLDIDPDYRSQAKQMLRIRLLAVACDVFTATRVYVDLKSDWKPHGSLIESSKVLGEGLIGHLSI